MFPSTDISDSNPDLNPASASASNPNPNPNPNYGYFQQDDTPNSLLFSNFPSPFLDDQYSDLFPTHHHLAADQSQPLAADPPQKKMRKDRHSKICTAQGVRARRMRLPLQIARKFFDLQDMLGYDKASKTIEWLMSKSTGAIREITKNISSTSNTIQKGQDFLDLFEDDHEVKKRRLDREKARSRARERTIQKMRKRNMEKMTELGSSSSKLDSSLNKQFSDVGINADCSVSKLDHENILGGFDYNNSNSFMEFLGNWDVENQNPLR